MGGHDWREESLAEGEFNAESYEPSAERSLRISRCKARMRENEKRRENDQLADHEARLKCASRTETTRKALSQDALRRPSNAS